MSNFAILRTQKLKSRVAVHRSLKHAFRVQETPNADARLTPENTHIGAHSVQEALKAYSDRLPEKVRKNAVHCIEYLITASPEAMHAKDRQEQDAYFADALEWLKQKHGEVNVVYAGIHRDERTPHMYAYVVPIDEHEKLNCRAFLGGSKALSDMQTDFQAKVGLKHGLKRGVKGSKAKHQRISQFYKNLENKEFEELNAQRLPYAVKGDDLEPKPLGYVRKWHNFFRKKAIMENPTLVAQRVNKKFVEPMQDKFINESQRRERIEQTYDYYTKTHKVNTQSLAPDQVQTLEQTAERLRQQNEALKQEQKRRELELKRQKQKSRGRGMSM